ncbi:DUF2498 family protein [Salmonella enterica subsp. enterica]|nr:DUF2498 family protein [Salmonella enterica subsp. enterica]
MKTQHIDRETLLLEITKLFGNTEDTMAGIVATGVTQKRNGVRFSAAITFRRAGLPTLKSTAVF